MPGKVAKPTTTTSSSHSYSYTFGGFFLLPLIITCLVAVYLKKKNGKNAVALENFQKPTKELGYELD